MSGLSINDMIRNAGITITGRYTGPKSPPVYWEYNGKRIQRPENWKDTERVVFEEFGITLNSHILCSKCRDYEMSEIEGYKHLCVACACSEMDQEYEKKWEKELSIYETRTGIKYDFDEFCIACGGEEPDIDKSKLRGLPELKRAFQIERANYLEYTRRPRIDPQLKLNFSSNELPF